MGRIGSKLWWLLAPSILLVAISNLIVGWWNASVLISVALAQLLLIGLVASLSSGAFLGRLFAAVLIGLSWGHTLLLGAVLQWPAEDGANVLWVIYPRLMGGFLFLLLVVMLPPTTLRFFRASRIKTLEDREQPYKMSHLFLAVALVAVALSGLRWQMGLSHTGAFRVIDVAEPFMWSAAG